MKNIKYLFLSALLFPSILLAENPHYPFIALDAPNIQKLPKNFRTSFYGVPSKQVSTLGLKELREIGSAQFSEGTLQEALKKLPKGIPIVMIDLRQETHGFIDGNAVSLYDQYNWGNLGKTSTQIHQEEEKFIRNLKKSPQVTVFQINKEKLPPKLVPHLLPAKNISSEKDLLKKYHLGYQRIYVTDHCKPTDDQVDQFIQTVRNLTPKTWLYFHCRAGAGRTTTFMALYDMMHNSKKVSFDDILKRQALIGGRNLISGPKPKKDPLLNDCYNKRVRFLKSFYRYTQENQDQYSTLWSTWLKNKKIN